MAGEPNDVSYENNKHIQYISMQYTPKDVAVWPNGRVSIVNVGEDLLFNVVSPMLRNGSEGSFYEHIPLDKSGEDNRRIQLKRMLIKGPVSIP